jgi:CRP-like cAMP-binding protein
MGIEIQLENEPMYNVLFDSVSALIKMPDTDKTLCYQYFEPVTFPKNHLVEKAGRIPQYQYFIVTGIMRNFYLNDSGEEVTTDMNHGPRFFTSYNHFVNRTISNENIECLTECSLLRIKRDDVDILYQKSDIITKFTILLLEKVFEEERNRVKEFSTLTAKQRYLKFIEERPSIIQNVSLRYIASYLGMKPETISRIRANLIS